MQDQLDAAGLLHGALQADSAALADTSILQCIVQSAQPLLSLPAAGESDDAEASAHLQAAAARVLKQALQCAAQAGIGLQLAKQVPESQGHVSADVTPSAGKRPRSSSPDFASARQQAPGSREADEAPPADAAAAPVAKQARHDPKAEEMAQPVPSTSLAPGGTPWFSTAAQASGQPALAIAPGNGIADMYAQLRAEQASPDAERPTDAADDRSEMPQGGAVFAAASDAAGSSLDLRPLLLQRSSFLTDAMPGHAGGDAAEATSPSGHEGASEAAGRSANLWLAPWPPNASASATPRGRLSTAASLESFPSFARWASLPTAASLSIHGLSPAMGSASPPDNAAGSPTRGAPDAGHALPGRMLRLSGSLMDALQHLASAERGALEVRAEHGSAQAAGVDDRDTCAAQDAGKAAASAALRLIAQMH